jgi:hypothetical protein
MIMSHLLTSGNAKSFAYKVGSLTIERVVSITDLGVILDITISFRNHMDANIVKGLAMLCFMKRLSNELRDLYTLKALYVLLVRSRIEYASILPSLHVDQFGILLVFDL